jgi:(2Fe-2S) ferredoxin
MATVDKDFKVKNGLVVTNGGTFGDAVTVGEPTLANHAATKEYVDSLTGSMAVGTTAPSSPTNGTQWLDTLTNRVNFYYNGAWYTQATIDDTLNIVQHIHDTAIDGTGLIVTTFTEGGGFNSPQSSPVDGGGPETTEFSYVLDGGTVLDNFN